MVAVLARTRSRSTTTQPFRDHQLDRATQDLEVFVPPREMRNERQAPRRVRVDQEPAVPKNLHGQDRRRRVEIDQIDALGMEQVQRLASVEKLHRCRATAKKRSEIDV